MSTEHVGIDYGLGQTNIDKANGIRFGVIPQREVIEAWGDASEADYGQPDEVECPHCKETVHLAAANASQEKPVEWGDELTCPHCGEQFDAELPDFAEPLGFSLDDGEYKASCGEDRDIFVLQSPFFTRAQFCSPCAPGACYLLNPCEDGPKAYCFGHDWFDGEVAPYPVYSVETGELVKAGKGEA